jgi:hypothetical protein
MPLLGFELVIIGMLAHLSNHSTKSHPTFLSMVVSAVAQVENVKRTKIKKKQLNIEYCQKNIDKCKFHQQHHTQPSPHTNTVHYYYVGVNNNTINRRISVISKERRGRKGTITVEAFMARWVGGMIRGSFRNGQTHRKWTCWVIPSF